MNKEERITYEEFMTMFKNAPRIAYMLYDKAEDEIDRLNNIISKLEKNLEEAFNELQPNELVDGRQLIKNILTELKEKE